MNEFEKALSNTPISQEDLYPAPEPIKGLENNTLPTLKPEGLPGLLGDWAQAQAQAMNAPIELLATAGLAACAGAVGNKVLVLPDPEVNPDYALALNLWALLVGNPGTKKSPIFGPAFRPLEDIETTLVKNNKAAKKAFESALEAWREKREGEMPEKPLETALVVKDITPEALGEVLEANPTGVFSMQAEMIGLLRKWGRPDNAPERAFYLDLWNGTSAHQVRRIQRGNHYLPITTLTLVGTTQPDTIREDIAEVVRGTGNDGLLLRFQLFVNGGFRPYKRVLLTPEQKARFDRLKRDYTNLLERLYTIGAELPTLPIHRLRFEVERPYLRFDDTAQDLYTEYLYENSEEIGKPNTPSAVQGMLSKHEGLLPKLAAICQLIEEPGPLIGPKAFYQARYLVEFYKAHTLAAWVLVRKPEVEGVQVLAKALLERKQTKTFNFERFTARDIYRSDWRGLTDRKAVQAVLEELLQAKWIIQEQDHFRPNPRIWEVQR